MADCVVVCAQAQSLEPDDPTIGYMLQAGARLCKTLGEEFLPYLDTVMPPLLVTAQLKPDVDVADAGSGDDEEDDDDDGEVSQRVKGIRLLWLFCKWVLEMARGVAGSYWA